MSKRTNKLYNFQNKEVKKKVAFRLFVKYYKKSPYYKSPGPQFTYRGYFSRPDKGRGRLMHIFLSRYEDIFYARLFNDITGEHQTLKDDRAENKKSATAK